MSLLKKKAKKTEEAPAEKADATKSETKETKESKDAGKDADTKDSKEKPLKSGDSKAGESKSPKTSKKKGSEVKDKEEVTKKKKDGDEKDKDSDATESSKEEKDKDAGKKKSKGKKDEEPAAKKDDKKSKSKSRDDDKVATKDAKGKGKKDVESEEEEETKEETVEEPVVEQKPYDADSSVFVLREGSIFAYEKVNVKVNDDKSVTIRDLPSSFVPSSLLFRSLSDPAASLSEQTFLDGSQSLSQLLADSRGKVVALRLKKASESLRGKVVEVAADDVTILREDEDSVVVVPKSSIALVEASNKVVDITPTLRGVIETETLGEHKAEITYSAEGITWSADYSLLLLSKTEAEVAGWYTINNTSGKEFHNSAFTLVAEVSGYAPPRKLKPKLFGSVAKVLSPRDSEGSSYSRGITKEQIRYHLPRPLTIGGHETKQIRLVSGKVPIMTVNLFSGCPHRWTPGACWPGAANPFSKSLQLVARFDNNKEAHASLGVVLPAGSLDVYQRTHQETFLDLVYQHHIERAQPGDTVNFPLGPEKPLLTAERKSLDYKHDNKRRIFSETVQIEIKNKTGKTEEVLVEESLYRWKDYQVSGATPKPTWAQKGSHTLLWQLTVKPDTTAIVKYQVVYNGVPN